MIKKIEQKVIKFIKEKNLLNKNDKVLVALSGGPDSIFLLFFLNRFKSKYQIRLGAVHVNHKLRGNEADIDEEFCRKICKKLNIEFYSEKKNVKNYSSKRKISFEEAGREIRYKVFKQTALKNNFNKIATAHNLNDNAETILLNLIKGSGIRGISGIPIKRENIIRPILILSKEEVLEYLNHNGIPFRMDITNLSINYERNFLRHEIIPLLKEKLNPSLENTLFNSSEVFKKISVIIRKKIEIFYKALKFDKKENLLKISLKKLYGLDKEYLGDFLKEAVKRNFSIQLSFNDIDKLISLFNSNAGIKINLSQNLSAIKDREEILIVLDLSSRKFNPVAIHPNESFVLNSKIFSIKEVPKENVKFIKDKNIEYISADKSGNEFILREWEEGDRFWPFGLTLPSGKHGSKKISDFLNDQKISSFLKKKQLVLTSQKKIVWVIGLRLDERFKLSNKTKKIYKLCLK